MLIRANITVVILVIGTVAIVLSTNAILIASKKNGGSLSQIFPLLGQICVSQEPFNLAMLHLLHFAN